MIALKWGHIKISESMLRDDRFKEYIQFVHHFQVFKFGNNRDKIYLLKYACLGSKVHSIKNIKFSVTSRSKRSCKCEDTSLRMGMTYLHVSTMKVTRLQAQVYKVTSLGF